MTEKQYVLAITMRQLNRLTKLKRKNNLQSTCHVYLHTDLDKNPMDKKRKKNLYYFALTKFT